MTRFIDFDAARAEREREPITLGAYGRTFELPSEMPAALYLDVLRMKDGGEEGEVSGTDTLKLMQRILPAAVLDELLAEPDFSLEDLTNLTTMVMQAYQGEEIRPLVENREERRHPAKSPQSPSFRAGSKSPKVAIPTPEPGQTSSQIGLPSNATVKNTMDSTSQTDIS